MAIASARTSLTHTITSDWPPPRPPAPTLAEPHSRSVTCCMPKSSLRSNASASVMPSPRVPKFASAVPSISWIFRSTSAWSAVNGTCGPCGIVASATRSAGLSWPTKRLAASIAARPRPTTMLDRSMTIMINRPPAAASFET